MGEADWNWNCWRETFSSCAFACRVDLNVTLHLTGLPANLVRRLLNDVLNNASCTTDRGCFLDPNIKYFCQAGYSTWNLFFSFSLSVLHAKATVRISQIYLLEFWKSPGPYQDRIQCLYRIRLGGGLHCLNAPFVVCLVNLCPVLPVQ